VTAPAPLAVPVVGRAAERQALRAALAAAQGGTGGVVLVTGPAGIGTRSQLNAFSFGRSEARLIWVMVIAASPVKKSTVSPGPGMALSWKMALWMAVIASTMGCSALNWPSASYP